MDDAYWLSDGRYFLEKIGFSDGTEWGLEEIAEKVSEAVGAGSDGDDRLNGYGDSYGYSSNETFHGGAGNDTINGNGGNDILYGEEGDDTLYGGYGDDYLEGGTGNDYLNGGEGRDTYRFDLGWGADTIYNYDLSSDRIYDRIEFGMGIYAKNLALARKSNDLVITDVSGGDTITIRDAYYYTDERCQIENIIFADGTKGTIDYDHTEIVLEEPEIEEMERKEPEMQESAADMESLTDSGAAILTTILTISEDNITETGFLPELPITDIMVEDLDVHDEEALNDTEGMITGDKESNSAGEETSLVEIISSDEIAVNDTGVVDIESSTDESAAQLSEVLTAEAADNEDTVYTEDYVLTNIMAEDDSSNMDESTDLQAMLMVQELSGSEDNNICSNDMENNIYEMPLFTEQFAIAE